MFIKRAAICMSLVVVILLLMHYLGKEMLQQTAYGLKLIGFRTTSMDSQTTQEKSVVPGDWQDRKGIPHLAFVSCGNRIIETVTMLTSAVLFTKTFLIVHVVTDKQFIQDKIVEEVDSWPSGVRSRFKYIMYNASFPNNHWKMEFKRCATQRLFFGDLLRDVDSVIYVDVDTLFFAPIEELWSIFNHFNSSQFIGVATDTDMASLSIYNDKRIPIYGANGVNTGVLLMNLTRLRLSTWNDTVHEDFIKYHRNLKLGDNDLINIYLHDHPVSTWKSQYRA